MAIIAARLNKQFMDFDAIKEQSNSLYHQLHEIHVEFYRLWVKEILFTWRWWISVSMIILPWTLWIIIRRRESSDKLLYAGFFVMLVSSLMDAVGIAFNLWTYPINVFPLMPEFIPFDICVLPVATMLFLQFYPKVNSYIKGFIYAASACFIFQPISSWIGLHDHLAWKNYYSFPILFLIYLGANYMFKRNKFESLK